MYLLLVVATTLSIYVGVACMVNGTLLSIYAKGTILSIYAGAVYMIRNRK